MFCFASSCYNSRDRYDVLEYLHWQLALLLITIVIVILVFQNGKFRFCLQWSERRNSTTSSYNLFTFFSRNITNVPSRNLSVCFGLQLTWKILHILSWNSSLNEVFKGLESILSWVPWIDLDSGIKSALILVLNGI